MNREEAYKLFREDKNAYGCVKSPMNKLKQIYDESESQICENCISWNKDYPVTNWYKITSCCVKHNINRKAKDFCSDFKKKD